MAHSSALEIIAGLKLDSEQAEKHLESLKSVVEKSFNIKTGTLKGWQDIGKAIDSFGGNLSIVKDQLGNIDSLTLNLMNHFGQMQTISQRLTQSDQGLKIKVNESQLVQEKNLIEQLISATNKYKTTYNQMSQLQEKNSAAYDIASAKLESYAKDIADITGTMQKYNFLEQEIYSSTLKWATGEMEVVQITAEENRIRKEATSVYSQLTQAIKAYNEAETYGATTEDKQEVYNLQLQQSLDLATQLAVKLSELGVDISFEALQKGKIEFDNIDIAARAFGKDIDSLQMQTQRFNNSIDLSQANAQFKEQQQNYNELLSTIKRLNQAQIKLTKMQGDKGYSKEAIKSQQEYVTALQGRKAELEKLVKIEKLEGKQLEEYNLLLKQTEAELLSANRQTIGFGESIQKNAGFLARMGTEFKRVIEFTFLYNNAYKVIGLVSGKIQEAEQIIKDLDDAIVDLRMATGGTKEETKELISSYNKMAIELGSTTTEVAKAADTWLRMGYTQQETNTLIKNSMVLSKVGQLESAEATQYLVSAMKGFDIEAENSIEIVDKLTAVDLVSATSADGLAIALSRTAESAKLAGASIDKTIGYIATVAEVTQKSEESIGESFKTIFARLENVKAGVDVDEAGESLNDVEKVLNKLGISLRDSQYEFRNMSDVLDEISNRWKDFSSVEQAQIATAIAGKQKPSARMYSNIQCFAV